MKFTAVGDVIIQRRMSADFVLVSIHSHEITGESKENVPEFLKTLAHRAVECGASAVIGHGPHLLRLIEVYRDVPIFYSLGDFILELYSVRSAPEDFYEKYGMSSESGIYELLKKRSIPSKPYCSNSFRYFTQVLLSD